MDAQESTHEHATATKTKKLSAGAIHLLDKLIGLARHKRTAYVSEKWLAWKLHRSIRTVQRHVRALLDAGLIEVNRAAKMCGKNEYRLANSDAQTPVESVCTGDKDVVSADDIDVVSADDIDVVSADDIDVVSGGSSNIVIGIQSGGQSYNTTQPPAPKSEEPKDPPAVEAWLERIRQFDALPASDHNQIVAFVRQQFPLFAMLGEDQAAFRNECVAVMVQWLQEGKLTIRPPEVPFEAAWEEFKAEFCRLISRNAVDYLDVVERRFRKIGAIRDEMLFALHAYLDDPRRDTGKWDGRYPREAYRYLPRYITDKRAQEAREAAERRREANESAKAAATLPDASAQTAGVFPDEACSTVMAAIKEKIGASSFEVWFRGKTLIERAEGGFVLVAANKIVRDFLWSKFRAEIVASASAAEEGAKVRVIVRE